MPPLNDYQCSVCGHIQYDEYRKERSNKIECPHCETLTADRLPSAHGGYAISGNNSASVTPKGSKSFKRST